MALIRENLVLLGEERAAGVDEVEAGQAVLPGDILRAQMLLDRQRIVSTPFDGRVIRRDQAFPPRDAADASNKTCGVRVAAIKSVRGERRDLEKRRARIEQEIDAVANKQFAAGDMARPRIRRCRQAKLWPASRARQKPASAWRLHSLETLRMFCRLSFRGAPCWLLGFVFRVSYKSA